MWKKEKRDKRKQKKTTLVIVINIRFDKKTENDYLL